jgi:hypothetical protein
VRGVRNSFQARMQPIEMTSCPLNHTRAGSCRPPNVNQAWKCSSFTWRPYNVRRSAANRDPRSTTSYYVLPAFRSPAHTNATTEQHQRSALQCIDHADLIGATNAGSATSKMLRPSPPDFANTSYSSLNYQHLDQLEPRACVCIIA